MSRSLHPLEAHLAHQVEVVGTGAPGAGVQVRKVEHEAVVGDDQIGAVLDQQPGGHLQELGLRRDHVPRASCSSSHPPTMMPWRLDGRSSLSVQNDRATEQTRSLGSSARGNARCSEMHSMSMEATTSLGDVVALDRNEAAHVACALELAERSPGGHRRPRAAATRTHDDGQMPDSTKNLDSIVGTVWCGRPAPRPLARLARL